MSNIMKRKHNDVLKDSVRFWLYIRQYVVKIAPVTCRVSCICIGPSLNCFIHFVVLIFFFFLLFFWGLRFSQTKAWVLTGLRKCVKALQFSLHSSHLQAWAVTQSALIKYLSTTRHYPHHDAPMPACVGLLSNVALHAKEKKNREYLFHMPFSAPVIVFFTAFP